MKSYSNMPPEKYYEACITYHLIQYFENIYSKVLYPFSISQIRENQLGFDFGYEVSRGNIFLTQYKRPMIGKDGHYAWRIAKAQLNILLTLPVQSFYVLPAFSSTDEWYEGMNKTYFPNARTIRLWMNKFTMQKSALLYDTDDLFSAIPKRPFDLFGTGFNSVAQAELKHIEYDYAYFENLWAQDDMENICGYRIGDE